jgi:hypothetical protein
MFDAEYFSKADMFNPSKDFKLGVYDYVLNSMLHQADLFKVLQEMFHVCKRQTS